MSIGTSIRYQVGNAADILRHRVLASRLLPLSRYVPYGLSWVYDAQRFLGRRDLNVVFDVGANVGQTVCGLLRYIPGGSIYAFEPAPETFDTLRVRYGHIVTCEKLALGAAPGELKMALQENSELNSFREVRSSSRQIGETIVRVATVDDYCAAKSIDRINILKMDVQGWELEVLLGASKYLRERRISTVLAEVGFHDEDTDMQHFGSLHSAMQDYGFELAGLYDLFRWGPKKAYVGFGNALYVLAER